MPLERQKEGETNRLLETTKAELPCDRFWSTALARSCTQNAETRDFCFVGSLWRWSGADSRSGPEVQAALDRRAIYKAEV